MMPKERDNVICLVPWGGIEPPTLGLEVPCSIQLSYQGRKMIQVCLAAASVLRSSLAVRLCTTCFGPQTSWHLAKLNHFSPRSLYGTRRIKCPRILAFLWYLGKKILLKDNSRYNGNIMTSIKDQVSASPQKTFVIIDGNALLHRAWHAIPLLTTQDGRVVNAVYGFVMVIEKMRAELKPDFMAVAWDLPGGTFRHEAYAEYKATREKKAQELYDQIPMIQSFLTVYGIPSWSVSGFEGDDILGTVSAQNEARGIKTLIVTGDLDALQLVGQKTEVLFFIKGLSQTKKYTIEAVQERYGLLPSQLIDYKTLVGDASDNLPGIAGIGEKTALMLLNEYGTVEGIFAAIKAGKVPEKFAKKFLGQESVAQQMRQLVTIVRDVPLACSLEESAMSVPDIGKLLGMLRDFEFTSIAKKYEQQKPLARTSLQKKALADFDDECIGMILLTKDPDLFGNTIRAIAVTDGRGNHVVQNPSQEEIRSILAVITHAQRVVMHDAKENFHTLSQNGFAVDVLLRMKIFDTRVGAYLLASSDREFAFRECVRVHLGAALYEGDNAEEAIGALLPLEKVLKGKLEEEGMSDLAQNIEMPLIPVLFTMEQAGFAVDREHLVRVSQIFETRLQELTKQIYRDAGRELNINSPSQLAEVLFGDLAIPTKGIKKTKSGFSTAASELEKLVDLHPIVARISEYRELAKLKGTYADTLPQLIDHTGRIHARFNQCVAATGRLSGSDPNLQNIPIRSELGREIRKAFIAAPGWVLVSADYSQIELRLAASIAHDQAFISAFRDGADIHKRTAAEMWNIPEGQVTKEQRYAAKAINFGILYGIGARALARSAGVKIEEAQNFIERYFLAHPGIAEYLNAIKLQARTQGFVTSSYGRRRYFPEMNSGMPQLIAAAERMAINMPIQATQADIIKMAMIEIDAWIRSSSLPVRMIAQVHDELVFEVQEKEVEKVSQGIQERMQSIVTLAVPLVVDIATAHSWGDME